MNQFSSLSLSRCLVCSRFQGLPLGRNKQMCEEKEAAIDLRVLGCLHHKFKESTGQERNGEFRETTELR